MKNCALSIKSAWFTKTITIIISFMITLSFFVCFTTDVAYGSSYDIYRTLFLSNLTNYNHNNWYFSNKLSFDSEVRDKLYNPSEESNSKLNSKSSMDDCKVTGVPYGWFENYYAEKEKEARKAELEARHTTSSTSGNYSSGGAGTLTRSGGVNYYNGRKETWYSQRVLPGGGLNIPGRHVEPTDGTVRDGDGYICVAASDLPRGTVVETSLGTAKVYDTGCAAGTTDVYVDW